LNMTRSRRPGESRGPESLKTLDPGLRHAGMTVFFGFCALALGFMSVACGPTYKRETMKESIKELAKKEYKLDVKVLEVGETIGVQFRVNNMLGELVAEDQMLWEQMEDMMLVLSRIMLSADDPPEFMVLDVVDGENTGTHLIFTRYTYDIKKVMGEVLSRNQYFDRLLMEFVIGGRRTVFDPYEMDIVRLMMMAMDSFDKEEAENYQFELEEVVFTDYLAKVAANTTRRTVREKKSMKNGYVLRQVTSQFDGGHFKILLDLVTRPGITLAPRYLDKKVLPIIAEEAVKIFKSYKFEGFSDITVIEKNSGKMFMLMRK